MLPIALLLFSIANEEKTGDLGSNPESHAACSCHVFLVSFNLFLSLWLSWPWICEDCRQVVLWKLSLILKILNLQLIPKAWPLICNWVLVILIFPDVTWRHLPPNYDKRSQCTRAETWGGNWHLLGTCKVPGLGSWYVFHLISTSIM